MKYAFLIFSFFSPIHFVFLLIGLGIVIDTYVGRWSARHKAIKNGWEIRKYVSSKKTRFGLLSKMFAYQTSIATLFILDKYMLHDAVRYFFSNFPIDYIITKSMGLVLIFVEFDSIDEKYYNVTGTSLKSKIKSKIREFKEVILKVVGFKKQISEELNDKNIN